MSLNNGQAHAVNILARYLAPGSTYGGMPTDDEACDALAELADGASRHFMAGANGADVRKRWFGRRSTWGDRIIAELANGPRTMTELVDAFADEDPAPSFTVMDRLVKALRADDMVWRDRAIRRGPGTGPREVWRYHLTNGPRA